MKRSDFNEKIKAFDEQLSTLQEQCSEAERNCIIAETNLKSLHKRQEELIKECEQLAGRTVDDIPAFLNAEEQAIEKIMTRLSSIDIGGEITADTVNAIKIIAKDLNIS